MHTVSIHLFRARGNEENRVLECHGMPMENAYGFNENEKSIDKGARQKNRR